MKDYEKTIAQTLTDAQTTLEGLSNAEVQRRAAQYGRNRLKEGRKTPLIKRFLQQLADPMIIILLAAALISGVTSVLQGESMADVFIILIVVIINAVLNVLQESKAEKAVASLQEMSAATSKVLRDGRQQTVASEALVPGDVILLEAGDAVPADARVIEAASLKVEEAALTGESVPVTKQTEPLKEENGRAVPLGDRSNMVYMGSTVAYGRGKAVITQTGMQTEMGKIADALDKAEKSQTPLQIKLSQLSKTLTYLVVGICAVIFAVGVLRHEPVLDSFMVAVSLAVAAIPEGLAAVVTIVLSIGVIRMSKRSAIIRKLTAVETLGCAQIICSDKTGTLTQNKMTVVETAGDDAARLATAMALCSDAELDETGSAIGEPTECALVNYAAVNGLKKPALKAEQPRVGEAPFDSMRKMMSTLHRLPDGSIIQYTKGAPDEVLKNCTHALVNGQRVPLTADMRAEILAQNKHMADRALRVLCAAERKWDALPENTSPAFLEQSLTYIGLTGMIDPVRPEVKPAIEECRRAGIRPIMITGDHRDTAVAIAMQLGLITSPEQAITGAQLDEISDDALDSEIEKYSVYARVQPEHKVRIVNAWKKRGKVTAMTGDGVNDAPSIKNADIGIGMGITGTDVTKNVADMVLADDNFATIVNAVGEGRRIYDNIRKAIQFLLASNMSEVLAIFFSTLLGFTILKPVHLLWINLITDCFPALALGMENGERDLMDRPPRNPREGIFAGGMGAAVAVQGVMLTVITMAAYFIGHFMEAGVWEITNSADGMTMAFLALSMAEIFHSFNMRSLHKSVFRVGSQNLYIWGAMLLSLISTAAVIYIPFLSNAFGFESISLSEYVVGMLLALSIIPMVEIEKVFERRRDQKRG